MQRPPQEKIKRGSAYPAARGRDRKAQGIFRQGFVATPTFARAVLLAGNRIAGPALIEEHGSTTVLWPDDRLSVDPYGNLIITIGSR